MNSENWKQEMSDLITDVESRLKLCLNNIKQSGLSINEEFKAFFCRSLIERVATTFTMFEMELQSTTGSTVNEATISMQNEVETKPSTVFSANTTNVTDSVIIINDSGDEEIDDSGSDMNTRNILDENRSIPRGHQYSTRSSRNKNTTKMTANPSVEEDSVQQGEQIEANDMESIASNFSVFDDENTSEAESKMEMNQYEDRESEQSSDFDEEFSASHRVATSSYHRFICPIRSCFSKFTRKNNVNEHIKIFHGFKQPDGNFGVFRYECKLCKSTLHKNKFYLHFQRKHPQHPKADSKKYSTEKFIKMPQLKYKRMRNI